MDEVPQALEEANEAAKRIVKGWIQKTFHETSLQCLREQLQQCVSEDDFEFEVTVAILERCHLVCQRLAYHWEKRLIEANQNQVALWVKEVAATDDFWQQANHAGTHVPLVECTDEVVNSSSEGEPPTLRTAVEPSEEAPGSHLHLPLAKLRHSFSTCSDLSSLHTALRSLGKSGSTQWPLDWKIVEDYCQEQLFHRLHARTSRVTFEVIPKDLVQVEEDDDVIQSQRLKKLFKLKSMDDVAKSQQRRQQTKTRDEEDLTPKRGRPASDHPEVVTWVWADVKKTIQDKESLEARFVHSETDPDPPIALLGALRSVGHTRFELLNPDTFHVMEKQRRRGLATCVKQRLRGAVVLRDSRKSPMTKVVRAKSKEHYSIELDMGECLLEWKGMLFAFSSIEISLRDEDIDVGAADNTGITIH